MPKFPWDSLKAETLRILCRDLGLSKPSKREAMIDFLKRVDSEGLEKALEHEAPQDIPKKAEKAAPASPVGAPPSTAKRRLGNVVSDYNTRHKRARISDPGPRPSRRTTLTARVAPTPTSSHAEPKRPIGRPRKTTAGATRTPRKRAKKEGASAPSAPSSPRREVFDGVVLPAAHPVASKGKGKGKAREDEEIGEEDADGEAEMELVDEQVEGHTSRVESSLADSNKENESILGDAEPNYQNAGESVENGAAAGSPTRVPESTVQIVTVVQMPGENVEVDADVDAEGEVVAESDDTVPVAQGDGPPSHFPVLQETHPESDLTPEDVSNIEQILRSVAANGLSG